MAQRIDINQSEPVVGADGLVEMEFTGDEPGSLYFKNPLNGRQYRGAAGVERDGIRTGGHRSAHAHPDDVSFLLDTGKWRVRPMPIVAAPQPPPIVPDASVIALVTAAQSNPHVYVPNTSARRRYEALLKQDAPPGDPDHVDIQAHLPFLQETVPPNGVVLELGTRTGFSTTAFLTAVEEKGGRVYSVDIKERWGRSFDGHPNWTFIYGDSTDQRAVDTGGLNDQQIDVLLIDSDHSYAHVTKEIVTWAHRVKVGGVILFHDTDQEGVRKAVDELAAFTNWPVKYRRGSHGMAVVTVDSERFVDADHRPVVAVPVEEPVEEAEPRRRGRSVQRRG